MERELISKKEQAIDGLLISLSGGVIGIIGAIAEANLLSSPNPDMGLVIKVGGVTVVGASLALNGVVRYATAKNAPEEKRE